MASFQGPGTGISGTSNQFSVGYAQTSGYTSGNIGGYAPVAGNVQGYTAQAGYANQSSATAQTLQVQGAGSATWAWSGANNTPSWLWGSNSGNIDTVFANLQVSYAGTAASGGNANGYAVIAGNAYGFAQQTNNAGTSGYVNNLAVPYAGSSTWYWQGQVGYPNHYWGSNDGVNMYVWQFSQGYVGTAGNAKNAQYTNSAGYAGYANGFANVGAYVIYTTQGGYSGSRNNDMRGWCGQIRQGRNGVYGNVWGNNYAGYNFQAGYGAYANFTTAYYSYFGMFSGWSYQQWGETDWAIQGNTQFTFYYTQNGQLDYYLVG